MEATASIDNKAEAADIANSEALLDVVTGDFEMTGTMRMFLTGIEHAQFVQANSLNSMLWVFEDANANALGFYMPAVRLQDIDITTQGRNTRQTQAIQWAAEKHATQDKTLKMFWFAA
jgi:hypothetical protein